MISRYQDGIDFQEEEIKWFAQRINTSASGTCIVPTYLITKYKSLTGVNKDNAIIKSRILNLCEEYL